MDLPLGYTVAGSCVFAWDPVLLRAGFGVKDEVKFAGMITSVTAERSGGNSLVNFGPISFHGRTERTGGGLRPEEIENLWPDHYARLLRALAGTGAVRARWKYV
ncbi:hypothetical protein [Streptomyces tubercidicus]|uniref:hypothetical protein n=1 Tax=Streptomyces tubercidicus TaxID=47759 RepID=UPI0036B07A35